MFRVTFTAQTIKELLLGQVLAVDTNSEQVLLEQ